MATTILEQIQEEAEKPIGGKLAAAKNAVAQAVIGFWGRIYKLRLGAHGLAVGAHAGLAAGALALGATAAAPLTAAAMAGVMLKSLLESGKQIEGEKLAELIKEQEKAEAQEQREMHISVRDFHKEFENLVAKLGVKRLVIIVDDLDRCLPLGPGAVRRPPSLYPPRPAAPAQSKMTKADPTSPPPGAAALRRGRCRAPGAVVRQITGDRPEAFATRRGTTPLSARVPLLH